MEVNCSRAGTCAKVFWAADTCRFVLQFGRDFVVEGYLYMFIFGGYQVLQ